MLRACCRVTRPGLSLVLRILGSIEEQSSLMCLLHKQNKHLTAALALSFPLLTPEVGA